MLKDLQDDEEEKEGPELEGAPKSDAVLSTSNRQGQNSTEGASKNSPVD